MNAEKQVGSQGTLQRRWFFIVFTLLAAFGVYAAQSIHRVRPPISDAQTRFISLSPAITSTLITIGARSQVVGVSDYCHFAADVGSIRRVGSGYTPRVDVIVELSPTVLFVEAVNAPNVAQLAGVVRVQSLPWLTLPDVISSTRTLGRTTRHETLAENLAHTYETEIQPHVDDRSPRVLMVMAHVPGAFKEVVFIRKNSIHGRVLEAAGARNAIDEEVTMAPRLSLEQVILRDPDGIVILQSAPEADERLIEDWRTLSVLRAVKTKKITTIAASDVAIPGPSLLELLKRVTSVIGPWKRGT